MQTWKWVLPFIHWSTAVAHHCSAQQAPAASLQPFLKWICFQICKFLPEQTTAPVFPRTPSPPHPSGFGSAQPLHKSSRTAAHGDSRSQHPSLWSFVFHLVAPSCRVYRFFSLCLRYFSVSHSTGVVAMRYLPLGEGCQRTQSWDCNQLPSPLTEWAPTSTFKIKFSVLAHDQQGLSSTAFPAKCNTIIHASTPIAGLVSCNTGSVCPLWQAAEFEFWPIKSLIFT